MIKLLIVDDSPLMRRLLSDIFTAAGDFEVAIARSAAEALDMLVAVAPDVVTLDIHMPGMDGLACLDRIMLIRPCPVVMVSSLTADGADETLEAMALGALDFIAKPRGAVSLEIDALVPALVEKVRQAAGARISRATRLRERVRARATGAGRRQRPRPSPLSTTSPGSALPVDGLVLVGCSTGGPPALDALLGQLAAGFPWPIVIAQHMPASFTGPLARRLDRLCALDVSEVAKATPLRPGHAYIARGDADIVITRRAGTLNAIAVPSDPGLFWHPSVDRLVESALALVAPEALVGVLMTGMGTDGARAMAELKSRGGSTIAESADTAVVWGMPGALVAAGGASIVAPLDRIAAELTALFARGPEVQPRPIQASLSEDEMVRVGELLYRWSGMIFGASKRYYIERRIGERMARNGMADTRTYLAFAAADPAEREALINAFTINETYFYREDHQLAALSREILPELVRTRRPGDLVRIWSMPCSTGEEAYSIAIWLLENWPLVDAYNIEIVGSDIDTAALRQACAGRYAARALAKLPARVIESYFEAERGHQRKIIDDLRESVRFTPANIVDRATLAGLGTFDVILCRNLLIYFDDASRLQAASNLHDSLNGGGFLCLGHSESMTRISDRFTMARLEDAIVYRKP